MNIARRIYTIRNQNFGRNFYRKLQISAANHESSSASQPKVQEEKFDFEDLKVLERVERRKASIPPFMKNVFVSVFNRDLLAYPEIINKEESEALDQRLSYLEKVFSNPEKTEDERRTALRNSKLYAGPVSLTNNGLAMNFTEAIRYLETVSSDLRLSQELSDHWVGLETLRLGLEASQYQQIIHDLTSGDKTIALCLKEKIAERITQADFRTRAELDEKGVWRISGEKVCQLTNGYLLVLSTVDAERLKAFLVHPEAEGVDSDGPFVTFRRTPGTPLDHIQETKLSHTLGTSRLYAATLNRCSLHRAVQACVDYVKLKSFSGKPLSELSTIRATLGDVLLDLYASESTEYFTAGLLDGYLDPDAELEMAMCRNFISTHSINSLMKLVEIPSIDEQERCDQLISEMRHLSSRGETLDSINMFIALNGIQHAGKLMSEEIKQIRNPLFHPTFILKKVLANRHQEKDDPKLTLYLSEHLHPSLKQPSEHLEYCVLRMRYACETLMSRHGMDISSAFTELKRLAEAGTEVLAMTAVLARASRAYCIGLRNAEIEMKLAACFVEKTKDKVRRLVREIDDGEYLNLDHFRINFGRKLFENNFDIQKPTARVFW